MTRLVDEHEHSWPVLNCLFRQKQGRTTHNYLQTTTGSMASSRIELVLAFMRASGRWTCTWISRRRRVRRVDRFAYGGRQCVDVLWPGDHPPDQNETVIPRADVGLLSRRLFEKFVDGLSGSVSLGSGVSSRFGYCLYQADEVTLSGHSGIGSCLQISSNLSIGLWNVERRVS